MFQPITSTLRPVSPALLLLPASLLLKLFAQTRSPAVGSDALMLHWCLTPTYVGVYSTFKDHLTVHGSAFLPCYDVEGRTESRERKSFLSPHMLFFCMSILLSSLHLMGKYIWLWMFSDNINASQDIFSRQADFSLLHSVLSRLMALLLRLVRIHRPPLSSSPNLQCRYSTQLFHCQPLSLSIRRPSQK